MAGQGWRNFPHVRWTLRKDAVHLLLSLLRGLVPWRRPAASDCGSHAAKGSRGDWNKVEAKVALVSVNCVPPTPKGPQTCLRRFSMWILRLERTVMVSKC